LFWTTAEEGEVRDDHREDRHEDGHQDRQEDRHEDRHEDRWRIWRVTEPEPEYLRTMTRSHGARGPRDHQVRRWWLV
jgi:hypothetical protein